MYTQKRRRTWSYRNHMQHLDEQSSESEPLPIHLNSNINNNSNKDVSINNSNTSYQTDNNSSKIDECFKQTEHNSTNNTNNIVFIEKSNKNSVTKNSVREEKTEMASLLYLDNSQRAAVTFPPFVPLLIQAGAGSGKTQTMATRVAYLIDHYHISPRSILGICFTRQAAETLRERVRCILAQEMNLKVAAADVDNNKNNNKSISSRETNGFENSDTIKSKVVEESNFDLPLMSSSSTNTFMNNSNYSQLNNLNNMLAEMKLRTMHSFALEILRRYNCIDSSTNVFDAKLQRRLAWRVVEQFAMQEKSSEAVDELIGFVNKMKTRVHVNSEFAEPHYNKQAAYLFPFYERLLHEEQNAVDFGDLLQMFLQLLVKHKSSLEEEQYEEEQEQEEMKKDKQSVHLEHSKSDNKDNNIKKKKNELNSTKQITSEICLLLRKRFTHIVVDEFQDFNEIQLEILALLAGEEYSFSPCNLENNPHQCLEKRHSCQITCVGDPHQCIYAWRGALPEIFKTWSERFPQTHILTLSTNYRSTREIINVSNKLVRSSQVPFTAHSFTLKNKIQLNCPVTLLTCDTIADEAEGLMYLLEHYLHSEQELSYEEQQQNEEKNNDSKEESNKNNCNKTSETRTKEENKKQMYQSVFTSYNDVAILCRTRKRVQQMLEILDMHHIPSSHLQRSLNDNCTTLQALLSELRVCVDLEKCQDEDVRMILSHSPTCLTARARKELFFSLDAVVRERINEQEHKAKNIHDHSVQMKGKLQEINCNRVNKFVHSDGNHNTHSNGANKISYYSILRELVFYNFAAEKFPKLQVSKKSCKIIRSFIKITTEAASMLSRQTCNVDDVLQFVIQEGGFEHAMHQRTVLSSSNNYKNNNKNKEENDREKQKNKKNINDRNDNKKYKSPMAASLAKSVAQEFCTNLTVQEKENNKSENKRQEVNSNTENDGNDDETSELLADAHLSLSELLLQAYYEVLQMVQDENEEEEEKNNNTIYAESVSNGNIYYNAEVQALHNICQNTLCKNHKYVNTELVNKEQSSNVATANSDPKKLIYHSSTDCSPAMVLRRVIDQFISLLPSDDFGSLCFASHTANTSNTFTEKNNLYYENNNNNKTCCTGKVTVGTVHQAKGMEWPIVIIPGCWVGEFPIRTNSEEERRIFYVALTRAMRELYLVTADKYSDTLDGLSDATCGASVQQTPYLNCINDQLRKIRLSSLMRQTTTHTL